jgi:hypothetical protein
MATKSAMKIAEDNAYWNAHGSRIWCGTQVLRQTGR